MTNNNSLISIQGTPTPANVPKEQVEESVKDRERQKELSQVKFAEWARLMLKMIDLENQDEELRRVRKITKLMRYYRGEQRGFWDNKTGEWIAINPDDFEGHDSAMLLVNNQIRPMVKSLAKEWARARTGLKCQARDDTIQIKGAARYGTGILTKYQDTQMPETFKQREAKCAFLQGNYLRYTTWNKNANKHIATIPQTSEVKGKAYKDYWWCPGCDREGAEMPPDGNCPHCGAEVVEDKAPESTTKKLTGYKKEFVGDPNTELVDCREVKVHLRARSIATTPYVRRRQLCLVSTLKYHFPWASIKASTPSAITRYIQETELASGTHGSFQNVPLNYEGYGPGNMGTGLGGVTEFVRLWLRPSMYFDLEEKEGFELPSGVKIPAGTSYIEAFPNGMYIAFNGDGVELLDVEEEVIDRYWSSGSYDPLIESFWGDGLDDLLPMQEAVNEMQSLFIENLIHNASPKIIYNPWLIEAAMFSGNPSEMTPMSRSARRDDKPQDAAFVVPGLSIASDVPNGMNIAIDTMRNQSGAHLAMSGTNDPRLSTATSMAIARDASVAQLGPPLALKSECDIAWAYQVLHHIQDNWVDGVHDKLLGNYSIQEAQWFKKCDIERDIEIIAEPGSWIPRTDMEIRNDFLSFITAGGLPLGFANPQVPLEIKQRAAELFRMPVDLDKLQPDIRTCHMRIEQIQAVANVLLQEGVIDETTESDEIVQLIIADVPVDTFIDDHGVFVNTYTGWMKTDPGKYAPVVVQESIQLMIQRHMEAQQAVQDYNFNQQARYAAAAQAMDGMIQNAQASDAAAQQAAASGQNQQVSQPMPLGGQRPGTGQSRAAEQNQATPVS